MIQIYQPNNKNFENNGDMTLIPVSAPIHVILNGAWTAELTHPIDSEGRWKYIEEEAVIKMPSFNGDQLFRIKKVQKQDEGITASMQPIFYDAMEDCWLEDVRPTGKNGQQALEIMLSPNAKYSAQSDITKVTTAYYEYVNFLEALNGDLDQSFINRWGGEILLDNFTVIVNERVGSDRGTEIRYGKNIPENGMSYEEDCSTVITRIYPKAYNGRKMTGTKYVDSPLINRYQTVKTATMTFENIKLKEDLEGDAEETDIVCETQEELNQALRQACNEQYDTGIDKPTISISCDMVLLQNTDLYKDVKELETVSLGDTVHCINTKLGISTEARVVELEYDAVRKKVSSVEIGDYVYQYFDDVTSTIDQVEKVIRPDGTVMAERVQGILNGIYTQIRLQSTAAQKVDGIAFRVEELDESSPMYGCMIWGTQGIQISTKRTQDGTDWDWESAMTAKGIIADAIITGLLSDKTGRNYWDLDTGEISMNVKSLTIEGETVEDITSGKADETLNNFVDTVYNPTIGNLQAQIDGQIETYYYDYEPTLSNEPASEWTTEEDRKQHEGDLFYWKSKGYAYRFFKDGDTWKWQMVQDTDITKALEEAADAKDTADQKRRVFVTQPYPPYDVGDLWVGDDTSEMMRCQRARSSGSYVASDWIKAVKYTDDSELYNFVQNDYNETIKELYNSVDQKSETWYQATDPALEWTEIESTPLQDTTGANILDTVGETIITIWEKEKSLHNGDLWKNSATNVEYIYQNGEWVEMPIPDEVFDMIDGKAQIFVVQPTPPYDVGDVWFTGTTILVCNTKRENGSFSESDWGKKDNYTDDSALYEFIEGDYSETVENLKNQADKKAETWYQSTDPSTGWTAAEKQIHTGDLWYNTSDEKTYIYNGSAWELTKTTPPDEVFDAIDGKAQIFVSQPKPPYSVGDLWFNSATSDIMTCIKARSSGNYVASDWQKRNKYTDDSYAQEVNQELNQFITDYQDEIKEIQNQVDQKAETWYQTSDPALQWTEKESIPLADTTGASILDTTGATITTIRESEKMLHDGDLWHNPSNNNEYIYQDGEWHKTSIPDDVFDIIDGKAQIFVAQPYPPYSVGDLWFNSATSDIMTCVRSRSSGSYSSGDWQKRNKYTDDSYAQNVAKELLDFSDAVTGDISNLQTQIDGKIETYYYNYQPTLSNVPASQWTTTSERQKHVGDLFYWQSQGYTYRFQQSGSSFAWQKIQDSDISDAMEQASQAQDTADNKRRVFVTTPVPPYDVGDLWCGNSSSDLKRCQTARASGSYVASDWIKAVKYTDDSAVDSLDQSLTQQDIFNRLTNNGQTQGIYLRNGRLYINASYIGSGTLSADFIKGGKLQLGGENNTNGTFVILGTGNEQIGEWDSGGFNVKNSRLLIEKEGDVYSQITTVRALYLVPDSVGAVDVDQMDGKRKRAVFLYEGWSGDYGDYVGIGIGGWSSSIDGTVDDIKLVAENKIRMQGDIDATGSLTCNNGITTGKIRTTTSTENSFSGSVRVSGEISGQTLSITGSKNRIVKTKDYGERLQYCYEMPSPMFGDIGEAQTDENGECYLFIDDIFKQTAATSIEYQVFLQKEGQGDIWVAEKTEEYFVVEGTPNLKFAWELKAKQRDYEIERLDNYGIDDKYHEPDYERSAEQEIKKMDENYDYISEASQMVDAYYKGLEGAFI